MKNNNISSKFNVILDESDQYYKKISKSNFIQNAENILHVTATPALFTKTFKVDNVISLKPSENYLGLDKIRIIEKYVEKNSFMTHDYYKLKLN